MWEKVKIPIGNKGVRITEGDFFCIIQEGYGHLKNEIMIRFKSYKETKDLKNLCEKIIELIKQNE